MSLDGYVAGPNQSLEHPLGEGGERLHEWALATRSWREAHGREGGTTGPDDDAVGATQRNVGATIMGRRMFGGGDGPWGEEPWTGWWGDDPPFHHSVFVLTHHAREPLEMAGGTTFHFVTQGIEDALERARDAARGRDVAVGGGAEAAQQYIGAGLVDEMTIHVVPVLLGGGARLFDNLGGRQTAYECVGVVSTPAASHYTYRRAR
jgi:dihydrofolate reductase